MLTAEHKRELEDCVYRARKRADTELIEGLGELATELQEKAKSKQIVKRFTPGYDAEDKPKEKYYVNSDSEYTSTTKFFRDVMMASVPGGMESDELRSYVKKTSGYMEEGDLSQGGYAVPTEASSRILEKALEMEPIRLEFLEEALVA